MSESRENREEDIGIVCGEMMKARTICIQKNLKEDIDLMKFKKFIS